MSLREHWVGVIDALGDDQTTFLVPYRHGDAGWFDYQPLAPIYPAAVWHRSQDSSDWERIERLRALSRYDWNQVATFRSKEDGGHESPWLRFLAGANAGYPEEILRESLGQVAWRLDLIRADRADLRAVNIHHWQHLNPVTTEALLQLTVGALPPIYNGGLLFAPVRYFDAQRRRPGLPPDVAALVTKLAADHVALELVNLSSFETRELVIQAGSFGEHRLTHVRVDTLESAETYPGEVGAYRPPRLSRQTRTVAIDDCHLRVRLPPNTRADLVLGMVRFVNQPTYALPWSTRTDGDP
jgi:hypothetical protein